MSEFPFIERMRQDKVAASIALLQAHQPDGEYYGCFSGGKDSVVIKEVARLAGVRVTWHYNVTTIDPPELVRFIREKHPDVRWVRSKHGNFFHRMETKGFPTRRQRWCCQEYKESVSPRGAVMILGVRAAESARRAATWKHVTMHTKTKTWALAPILEWSDAEVWTFIRERGLDYCSLYDEGYSRLGCIGCPMSRGTRRKDFARWPRFEALWKRAFQRLYEARREGSMRRWSSWKEMWEWWLDDDPLPAGDDDEEGSCQLALNMLDGGDE